jgi:hypothetical protein
MRAKPDLAPDCDVHGEAMVRDERPALTLGLEGYRDELFWRCARDGCHRYFHGSLGYRDLSQVESNADNSTMRCERDGAFLVVQKVIGSYICPVAGCQSFHDWQMPERDSAERESRDAEQLALS